MQVKEIMTRDVAKQALARHISAAPVVDKDGAVSGLVSEGDLMRRVADPDTMRRPWWLELSPDPRANAADYVKTHGETVGSDFQQEAVWRAVESVVGEGNTDLDPGRIQAWNYGYWYNTQALNPPKFFLNMTI